MPTTWTDGVFEIEVEVAGRLQCQGREWEVGSVRCKGQMFLLAFREAAQTANYFFQARRSMRGSGEVSLEPMQVVEAYSLAIWRESLKLSLELGAWGRALWFDTHAQVCLSLSGAKWQMFLLCDGESAWGEINGSTAMSTALLPFDRDANAPSYNAPMSEWLNWTLRSLERQSDCRFALKFARLSHKAKVRYALGWRYGNLNQFERICKYIGQLNIAWDEPWDGKKLNVTIWLDASTTSDDLIYVMSDSRKSFPLLPDLTSVSRAWSRILSITQPQIQPSLLERKCVVAWRQHDSPRVEFWVASPNAHERIEALTALREWAKQVGIEAEMMKILHPSDA